MKELEKQFDEIISRALEEDLGQGGDVTTDALINDEWQGKADFLIKGEGILAGIEIARRVFLKVDNEVDVRIMVQDGNKIKPGDIVASVSGKLASILKSERTSLNFLQRLSGIASETARYVAAVQGLPVKILDTRKTTPGLRYLEKYAVKVGGGQNHRMNLGDGILIKDNHLEALYGHGASLKEAVLKARRNSPKELRGEVETKTIEEVIQAVEAGADIIMLDHLSADMMRQAVKIIKGRALVEASGNINMNNVRIVAETGVDFISVGALTHSVKSLDISLEFKKETPN
jgi:nicotinate-nucleotide pyrophosphorylase (carboxylating)